MSDLIFWKTLLPLEEVCCPCEEPMPFPIVLLNLIASMLMRLVSGVLCGTKMCFLWKALLNLQSSGFFTIQEPSSYTLCLRVEKFAKFFQARTLESFMNCLKVLITAGFLSSWISRLRASRSFSGAMEDS